MFETLELTRMARALAAHSGARLGVAAQNVANADTPGYRARDLPSFAAVYEGGGMAMRADRPGHFREAGANPLPRAEPLAVSTTLNGNGVSLEDEMVRAAEIRTAHDLALAVVSSVSAIQRAALGRR